MHTHESKLEKELIKLHLNSCVRFEVGKGCYEKACEYCGGGIDMHVSDLKVCTCMPMIQRMEMIL